MITFTTEHEAGRFDFRCDLSMLITLAADVFVLLHIDMLNVFSKQKCCLHFLKDVKETSIVSN